MADRTTALPVRQAEFIKAWCEEEHTEADLLPPLLFSL